MSGVGRPCLPSSSQPYQALVGGGVGNEVMRPLTPNTTE